MRQAKVGDYRRAVKQYSTNWPVQIRRLAITNVPIVGTFEISIDAPITVFAGANGVGKSSLLVAIWMALAPKEAARRLQYEVSIAAGRVEVDLVRNGEESRLDADFPGAFSEDCAEDLPEVAYLNAAVDARASQNLFKKFDDIGDLKNGVGERILTNAELEEISRICSRDYESVSIYEVEIGDGEIAPYAEACYGGLHYDARSMGAGEYSALYLWWSISRSAQGTILLVEEPEAFLSPAAQRRMMEHLVAYSVRRKLVIMVATHSEGVIQSIEKENLVLIARSGVNIELVDRSAELAVLRALGFDARVEVLCFVEDERAKRFLDRIVNAVNRSRGVSIDCVVLKGAGDISAAASVALRHSERLRVFGIYDGDKREDKAVNHTENTLCLPGDVSLELMIKQTITKNVAESEVALSVGSLSVVLGTLEGEDPHDWLEGFKAATGKTEETIMSVFFDLWFRIDENREQANELFDKMLN